MSDPVSSFLQSFGNAIGQMEGYFRTDTTTVAQINNNPGNLRGGPNESGVSASGYGVYNDASLGWQDLYAQIQKNVNRGLTLLEFFAGQRDENGNVIPGGYPGYAPSADSNNPVNYANFVGGQLGIPVDQPIANYLSGGGSSAPDVIDDTGVSNAIADATGQSGSIDPTLLLLLAAAGAAMVYMFFFRS